METTVGLLENNLVNRPIIKNANLFCQAFRIYKNIQLFSVDTAIRYSNELSGKWKINSKAHTVDMLQLQSRKVDIQKMICCGAFLPTQRPGTQVQINCPVDVYIYDTHNNLQGSIIDDVVTEVNNIEWMLISNNGIKTILILGDQEYRIELIGTDTGTLSYTISFYDEYLMESKRAIFYDIPLYTEKKLEGTIENNFITEPQFALKHIDGDLPNLIAPDLYFEDNTTPYVDIVVTSTVGGKAHGSSSYRKGDSALLFVDIDQGYTFDGWYENNQKIIDAKETYNFATNTDRTLEARFVSTLEDNISNEIVLNRSNSHVSVINNGDYFTVDTTLSKEIESNVAILDFNFDTDKFEYVSHTLPEGVTLISSEPTATGIRFILMVRNYSLKNLTSLTFEAKETIAEKLELVSAVARLAERTGIDKKEVTLHGSLDFDPNDEQFDLIYLSNVIDAFGKTKDDDDWTLVSHFDFNNNGVIDIQDIVYVATRIK